MLSLKIGGINMNTLYILWMHGLWGKYEAKKSCRIINIIIWILFTETQIATIPNARDLLLNSQNK